MSKRTYTMTMTPEVTNRLRADAEAVRTIPVSEVREGHMLPGLGHGYVFEVEGADVDHELTYGRFNGVFGEGLVLLSMNDADGGEFHALLPGDMLVQVVDS